MSEKGSERKITAVKVKNIHPSSALLSREHGTEVSDSAKAAGIRQWLMARPLESHSDARF